jgi:dipeptidyl aminopeptidase/acylaminoacyl peptidase
MGRRHRGALATAVLLGTLSCTSDTGSPSDAAPDEREESGPASSSPAPDAEQPSSDSVVPDPEKAPEAIDVQRPESLQAVMNRHYRGSRLHVIRRVGDYGAYIRSEVRYRSDGLRVTAIMNRPKGRGPFPAVVLNHGYIEPSIYVTGQGLAREQNALARAGYLVLHTDYRGHAGSDPASLIDRETRLGYTEDVITAVLTVRKLPYVDDERIGMLGRSMGGGVTYNALVAKPGLVDAAVVYAPVSSRFVDNLNRWTRPERPGVAERLFDRIGSPRSRPDTYRDLSPQSFFDRISEPILIHHGTADESCPLRWSRASLRALRTSGAQARLIVYPGEPHAFVAEWQQSMDTTLRFFERRL